MKKILWLTGLMVYSMSAVFASGKNAEPSGLSRRVSGETEYWQDVDALSSASLLKAGPSRFGYVDAERGQYYMKIVDVNNPDRLAAAAAVPEGRNVAMWTANSAGNIAVVTADQYGRSEFKARNVIIYTGNLQKLTEFPFGNPSGEYAQPLSHREAGLGFTEQYAAIGWNDNGGMYITVYSIADGKSGSMQISPDLGDLTALAINGDYLLIGGSIATGIGKITSGAELTLEPISGAGSPAGSGGCHWLKSNEQYALESVQGKGSVRVWKWQGKDPPSLEGTVSFGDTAGSVQAMSFGVDDPENAYVFGKAPGGSAGKAYRIDLGAVRGNITLTEPIFTKTAFGTESTGQMWIIERAEKDGDAYFALAGGVGANENGPSGFLFLKNPSPDAGDYPDKDPVLTYSSFNWFWTLVRSARLLKNDAGDIFFAGKNHAAREAYEITPYRLRLQKIN